MKPHKESHASGSKRLKVGEYGIGIKQPVGRIRDLVGEPIMKPKKMRKPPRKMA
jgi:hypothetical protein